MNFPFRKALPVLLVLGALGLLETGMQARAQAGRQRLKASSSVPATHEAQGTARKEPLTKATVRRVMLRGPLPAPSQQRKRRGETAMLAFGGIGGGVAGALSGAGLGYLIETATTRGQVGGFFPTGTAGAVLGGGTGLLFGVPLGVHLANGRHGNYLLDFLASAGAGLGSAALLASVLDTQSATESAFIIGVPITLQIGTSVAVEHATAR